MAPNKIPMILSPLPPLLEIFDKNSAIFYKDKLDLINVLNNLHKYDLHTITDNAYTTFKNSDWNKIAKKISICIF